MMLNGKKNLKRNCKAEHIQEKREYIFPQKWNQIKIEQIRAGNLHRPETKKNSKMNA